MRCRSKTRKISYCLCIIQRKNVNKRSWWINVECLKQELILFRWMDSKQYQIINLRYSTKRFENGCYFLRKLHCHLRNVQKSCWVIHCYVQKKSFPPLVHRRRYGRNGIHWSWIQHEWFGLWILIILRCHSWRRKRSWWRRSWSLIFIIFKILIIKFIKLYNRFKLRLFL